MSDFNSLDDFFEPQLPKDDRMAVLRNQYELENALNKQLVPGTLGSKAYGWLSLLMSLDKPYLIKEKEKGLPTDFGEFYNKALDAYVDLRLDRGLKYKYSITKDFMGQIKTLDELRFVRDASYSLLKEKVFAPVRDFFDNYKDRKIEG